MARTRYSAYTSNTTSVPSASDQLGDRSEVLHTLENLRR